MSKENVNNVTTDRYWNKQTVAMFDLNSWIKDSFDSDYNGRAMKIANNILINAVKNLEPILSNFCLFVKT